MPAPDVATILLLLGRLELQHKRLGLVNHAYGVRAAITAIQQSLTTPERTMMNQDELLEELRQQRLRQLLNGSTSIGKMHGADMNADMPAGMMAVWNAWWDKPFNPAVKPEPEEQGNGAYMVRIGPNQATYMRAGIKAFDVCRETPLQVMANLDAENLGPFWEAGFPGYRFVHLN